MKKKDKTTKKCSIMPINKSAANKPDNKAKIIRMPQRPVLYFFNIG